MNEPNFKKMIIQEELFKETIELLNELIAASHDGRLAEKALQHKRNMLGSMEYSKVCFQCDIEAAFIAGWETHEKSLDDIDLFLSYEKHLATNYFKQKYEG